jgi:tRNA threonylcarbamoyladenosine biosynthesis protein TsaB
MRAPTLLAIDCSTEALCLGACAGGRTALWHGAGGAQASAVLLARAQALLAEVGAPLSSLDAVAFARGPGAFTGLRTACATAQGLAFGVDCAVLHIDSLMIVAQAAAQQAAAQHNASLEREGIAAPFLVGVTMDARMGELYAGVYASTPGGWLVNEPPCLTTPAAWAVRWQAHAEIHALSPCYLAGSGVGLLQAAAAVPGTVIDTVDHERVAALMVLAQVQWQTGGALPAAQALPLYVRDKVAQTTAERQAAAGWVAASPGR